ncbi:MAG: hypothetical protein FWC41_02840, partial [Firmicutes bacterium]|nr:hypothetical protein [Bacillota bacterium]
IFLGQTERTKTLATFTKSSSKSYKKDNELKEFKNKGFLKNMNFKRAGMLLLGGLGLTVVLNEIYKKYKKEKVEEESVELDDKELESQGKENYIENYVEGYVKENNEEAQNGNEGNYGIADNNPTKIGGKGEKGEKSEANSKEGEENGAEESDIKGEKGPTKENDESDDEEENDIKNDFNPLERELPATQLGYFGFLGFKKLIDNKLEEQKDKEEKVIKINIITGICGNAKDLNAKPSRKNEKYIDQLVRGLKRFVNDFDKFKRLIGLNKHEEKGVKFEFKFSTFTVGSEIDNLIKFKSLEDFKKELDIGIEVGDGGDFDCVESKRLIFKALKAINKSGYENVNNEPDPGCSDYINLCNIIMFQGPNYEYHTDFMTDFIGYKENYELNYFFNFTTNKENSNEIVKWTSVLNGSCFYYDDKYYYDDESYYNGRNNIDFSECFPYSFKKMLFKDDYPDEYDF